MFLLLLACSGGQVALDPIAPVEDSRPDSPSDSPSDSGEAVDLAQAVTQEALLGHLDALQAIADDNSGHREAWSAGYFASLDYVQGQLEAAGYEVEREAFTVTRSTLNSASLGTDSQSFALNEGFGVFPGSGSGEISAPLQGVDLSIPPSGGANSSTSGCEDADFADFQAGSVALIQRGSCTFSDKVARAQAAGAVAVLIFNEGQSGRKELFSGSLGASVPIPVLALSYDTGVSLSSASEVRLSVDLSVTEAVDHNLHAYSAAGDPGLRVHVGAHLDSVQAGPGINDNGSGTAAVLETAIQLAAADLPLEHQVQFSFWGAEEHGLIGSLAWLDRVAQEAPGELQAVDAAFNFDMLGSDNGVVFLYDGDGSAGQAQYPHPSGNPAGSDALEALLDERLGDTPTVAVGLGVPSDSYGFAAYGIPTGGLFSGASGVKTEQEAADFGGRAGQAYDACYHQGCDDTGNIDPELYVRLAQAAAGAIQDAAMSPQAFKAPGLVAPRALGVPVSAGHAGHAHCGDAPVFR